MLRLSEFAKKALAGEEYAPHKGITLIWNLTKACNLSCRHCYASAGKRSDRELTRGEALSLIPELYKIGVRSVILSGGEPLMRDDIFEIACSLRERGIKTFLSTNGLLIKKSMLGDIKECFDYVGVSIDGTPSVHDAFRGERFSFEGSLKSLRLLLDSGVRTGLRFTLTELTAGSLPFIFDLAREVGIPRIYISHLVFSGRGRNLSYPEKTALRRLVEFIVDMALEGAGGGQEVVTGNSEPDAVVFLERFSERYPERSKDLERILRSWGGNQAGERLMCIDAEGNVKPDPFFQLSLGNVRERSLEEIWKGNGILSFLRKRPRRLKGRCSSCPHLEICNGGSRARAFALYGDWEMEDPGCYL